MTITLGKIADHVGAELHGDPETVVNGLATLQSAKSGQVSFLSNRKYHRFLKQTEASAVIITREALEECPVSALVVDDPYLTYASVVRLFHPDTENIPGIHPTAVISPSATIDSSVTIGANVVIEDNSVIESGTFIDSGCVIKSDVTIGSNTRLYPNTVVCHSVLIGNRVILHPGVVVGSDGFGIANNKGRWTKIPQIGTVIIEDDVEIGASSSIDRGALENTVIEQGVKIDNQVQIAHNVHIGAHTAIAGCAAVAGSTTIGKYCMIGGMSAIGGHLEIVDNVIITGNSAVGNSIKTPGIYSSGIPATEAKLWRRIVARIRKLDELGRRIVKLEEEITQKR
ncbi:MAG: UDP-3-O-(3-hydroxymyristoyl)glucosamine N-acyltransferase [Gammaproteobacteria bacterium]|nr:MAG: UDP-3-O-(3-hydroxymyristoyl)glucosamine N-acyltransferase [Gammaproteobacteria bacterium]RKZ70411.1 MAG: UDP-3-O-(3-hydroxymyristoyl)glucosamine N-acyltransferase [Gammaproteobacteria bacterium]